VAPGIALVAQVQQSAAKPRVNRQVQSSIKEEQLEEVVVMRLSRPAIPRIGKLNLLSHGRDGAVNVLLRALRLFVPGVASKS
jgi:hypothetical protein